MLSHDPRAQDAVSFMAKNPKAALSWGVVVLLAFSLVQWLRQSLRSDLRAVPGPWAARLSVLYRPWKLHGGDAPEFYRELHKNYGPIVRTAPNAVSISDPKAIAPIYAAGSKFTKVGSIETFYYPHH